MVASCGASQLVCNTAGVQGMQLDAQHDLYATKAFRSPFSRLAVVSSSEDSQLVWPSNCCKEAVAAAVEGVRVSYFGSGLEIACSRDGLQGVERNAQHQQ